VTALERVRSTRRALSLAAVIQSLAWGAAAALFVLATVSFATLAFSGIHRDAGAFLILAIAVGIVVSGALLWRSRHLTSVGRVAIWIEERIPGLEYALVTATEFESSPFRHSMETSIERHDIAGVTRGAVSRSILPAVGTLLAAAALLYVSPSGAFGGRGVFNGSGSGPGPAAEAGNRLSDLVVRVTPPAYTGERTISLDDPASVTALAGSRIVVQGDGSSEGITATVADRPMAVSAVRGGWSGSTTMPVKPAALMLRDRGYERIIVLDPRADNPPKVVLTSPQRDSTLRVPQLVLRLDATATDDVGLSGAYFEYLVTTGSGEIFSARTITTPVVRYGGARRGTMSATLDLASLKLNQGDVVSIRAIAQDGNTMSGPGLATSDTRTYRIARADEYDSVSIEAAGPLPVDSSAMSQRMLILMTEALVREQPKLNRQQLVKRSTEIGDLEDRVRKRVHEILFEQEGGEEEEAGGGAPAAPEAPEEHAHSDEPVPVRNADLLEAYNALWEAVRSLQIAEPAPALPPMRRALKALDRARLANRLYLRGLPPKVIVDLARVRMTGKEKGSANTRTPVSAADSAQVRLERGFNAAVDLIEKNPADAIRAFTMVQVDALATSPAFASAVGEAIEAFRKGRDATAPLLRARRALSGNPAASPGLPAWSGAW
jgi:hypothetical protein